MDYNVLNFFWKCNLKISIGITIMFLFVTQKVTYKLIAWLDLCIVPLMGIQH
jgi:hypothetical protein